MLCNRPIIEPEFILRHRTVDKWSGGRELQNGCLMSCRSLVCGVDVPWGDMQWFALATAPASSYLIGWDDWWKKPSRVSYFKQFHRLIKLNKVVAHIIQRQTNRYCCWLADGGFDAKCSINSCLSQSSCAKLFFFRFFLKFYLIRIWDLVNWNHHITVSRYKDTFIF